LLTGSSPANASSGVPAIDFGTALAAIESGADARFYAVTTSAITKQLALWPSGEMPTGTNLSPTGGTIAGIQVLASDAVDTGKMLIFDARQLAGDRGTVTLDTSTQGNIDPAGSTSPSVSFWQKNLVGLKSERKLARAPQGDYVNCDRGDAFHVPGAARDRDGDPPSPPRSRSHPSGGGSKVLRSAWTPVGQTQKELWAVSTKKHR
jgi:hypothetical protein